MDTSANASPRDQERKRLGQLPETDSSLVAQPGVLLADEIQRCCVSFSLISPFSPAQLKAASYRLTVGSRYSLGGKRRSLSASEEITIPAFQVAVIQTRETLNMPRDLIGRWNIKVSLAYKGLIWAGGPQVDPGYVGHLSCPIYNLSNEQVTLAYGTEIAVIDFVTTTAFSDAAEKSEFGRPPKDLLFEDYPTLESGLSDAWERIQGFESRIEALDTKVTIYVGLAVALVGIIIAALSVMVSANGQMVKSLTLSELLCLAFSGFAAALSGWACFSVRSRTKQGVLLLIGVGFIIGCVAMFFLLPLLRR
jgi:deoxycytidine triphosphate deaminase